jgi:biopolymer transport protein ExbB
MEASQTIGFTNFLAQTDAVGKAVLVTLLAMSLLSWYLIISKSIQRVNMQRRSAGFLKIFWNAPSLKEVAAELHQHPRNDPFSHLTWHGFSAARHHNRSRAPRLEEAGGMGEFLTRSMRRVIDEETASAESGLTLLASIGSTAPFVGLLGTVWGVYHALEAIGLSGQGTLDKVAGPVGEALIMTALGLMVAIPAVLAYNAFVRSNRLVLTQLDSFAHDLFAVLTTGAHITDLATDMPANPDESITAGAA